MFTWDAEKGELAYSAAGHPPMLLLREGRVSSIEENGCCWGCSLQQSTALTNRALLKGDRLLLYTDGVIEARMAVRKSLGRNGLCKLLAESAGRRLKKQQT